MLNDWYFKYNESMYESDEVCRVYLLTYTCNEL